MTSASAYEPVQCMKFTMLDSYGDELLGNAGYEQVVYGGWVRPGVTFQFQ